MKSIYKFIPYEKITFETGMKPEKVESKLLEIIETDPLNLKRSPKTGTIITNKKYFGKIQDGKIKLKPVNNGNKPFPIEISGTVKKLTFGSEIKLTIKLQDPVIAFLVLWFAFVGYIMKTTYEKWEYIFLFFPGLMIVFSIFGIMRGFKTESANSRNRIMGILMGSEKHYYQ